MSDENISGGAENASDPGADIKSTALGQMAKAEISRTTPPRELTKKQRPRVENQAPRPRSASIAISKCLSRLDRKQIGPAGKTA